MANSNNIIIQCENYTFVFNQNISINKAKSITSAIMDYIERNNVDLTEDSAFTFNGILTCPVKLIAKSGQITVVLPDINNNFDK